MDDGSLVGSKAQDSTAVDRRPVILWHSVADWAELFAEYVILLREPEPTPKIGEEVREPFDKVNWGSWNEFYRSLSVAIEMILSFIVLFTRRDEADILCSMHMLFPTVSK